jgi:hypothetical protein
VLVRERGTRGGDLSHFKVPVAYNPGIMIVHPEVFFGCGRAGGGTRYSVFLYSALVFSCVHLYLVYFKYI